MVFPGAVLLIARGNEKLFSMAVGNYAYDPMSPVVTPSAIYDIASVTKQIVATGALRLFDQGGLRLEERVHHYLPILRETKAGDVTIWNLLTHTSAISVTMSSLTVAQMNDIRAVLASGENDVKPGAEVHYGNINTFLLGQIIAKVSGLPLDKFIRQEILDPLEMADTMFNPPPKLHSRIVPSEITGGQEILQGVVNDLSARKLGGIAGHAGLFSTAMDLDKFLLMWMQGGSYERKTILREATVSAAVSNQTPRLNLSAGLGWHLDNPVYLSSRAPRGTFFHPGFTGTIIAGSPSTGLRIVFLSNATYPNREYQHLKNPFLKNLFEKIFTDVLIMKKEQG